MCDRLLHDVAWAGATAILEIFLPCLTREEEANEAVALVFQACKAMLESAQILSQREAARLRPSRN